MTAVKYVLNYMAAGLRQNIHLIDGLLLQKLAISHKALPVIRWSSFVRGMEQNNLVDKVMILYSRKSAEDRIVRELQTVMRAKEAVQGELIVLCV